MNACVRRGNRAGSREHERVCTLASASCFCATMGQATTSRSFYLRLMAVLNEERWLAHTYRCRSTNSLSGLFVWFGLFLSYHIVITVHLQLADSCEHACACLRACVHRDCMSQPLLCVWITFTLALSQVLASACRLVEKWSLIDWCHLDPVPACTRSFQISYFCTLHHSKHTSHSFECHLFVCVRGMAHH